MKKEIDKDAEKCVFCGEKPICVHYEADLWYYECSNRECDKHPRYAYMGFRKTSAQEQWNYANRSINRTPSKKGKKNENGNI